MTPLEYLNNVVEEYKELKSELIPIDLVLNENEGNLVFFQDKKINELSDNQSISYSNIGETLEMIIKSTIEYVDDLKKVDAVALDNDIKEQFLILNSTHYSDSNIDVVTKNTTASELLPYKDISKVKTFIDQINFSNTFSIFSKNKNREILTECSLYYLDTKNNIINKFTAETAFDPTSIWGATFIGIKTKEPIEAGDVISVNTNYTLEIRYNDFNYKSYNLSLTNQSGFVIKEDIQADEIPIFNIKIPILQLKILPLAVQFVPVRPNRVS